jgi:hypothetical protein
MWRRQDAELLHLIVALAINAMSGAAPPLIVIPLLKSCREELRALRIDAFASDQS